ncbi:hypothetical protein BN137_469 [Cronobacter condimenti 1330]|uniref:Uncharacterized protein n=1 Tax=Cronobacter condimenti 1330 TaxID=1073999 RepID=K7ZXP3_9ENTR|nr:hypothetical protein BN137_469 [Cronobacter condimenti 1330]
MVSRSPPDAPKATGSMDGSGPKPPPSDIAAWLATTQG